MNLSSIRTSAISNFTKENNKGWIGSIMARLIHYAKICAIIFSLLISNLYAQEKNLEKNVRTFVNLLDYIGTDYHNAVENGKVISNDEYSEMLDFAERAESVFENISGRVISNATEIRNQLKELRELIKQKSGKDLIVVRTNNVKQEILSLKIIPISPLQWPSLVNGKKIFEENCVSCHGENGDGNGPAAVMLNPKPANFLDDTLMSSISSFQIYNTIRLGINGTAMKPLDELNDKQVWDAAFYVSSLRYTNKYKFSQDSLNHLYKIALQKLSLDQISTLPDNKLIPLLNSAGENAELYLAAVRTYSVQKNSAISISMASSFLDEALNLYKKGNYDDASNKALSAYLEGIEPYEEQLAAANSNLKMEIEEIMTRIRNDIRERKPITNLNTNINKAKQLIGEASSMLRGQNLSFWFSFMLAASVLLREGLEAFLIIATILGVLKSLKAKQASKWVHGGWITALVIGIISMLFTNMLIAFGAQNRELMEGVGSLIAVVILLYVGFWLHSKTGAKKWKEFIEGKIVKLVEGNNKWGLAIISFVVVFREAFESAIFLSAVSIESDQSGTSGVYLGAASTLVLVLILSWLAVKFTARLPIRKLFQYSALTIAALSIVLVGKGIHALQESGFFSSTSISYKINFSWLGVYPTLETITAQSAVLILTVILWKVSSSPKIKSHTLDA